MSKIRGQRSVQWRSERFLGAVLDDPGTDGNATVAIGELLLLGSRGCQRVGRISALPVPCRDRATREPWRMAVGALFMLGEATVPLRLRSHPAAALLTTLRCGLDCFFTSSASCLVEAAAGLLGVDSPAALEDLAKRHGTERALAWGYCVSPGGDLDFLPLLEDLAAVDDVGFGAALFLATFADGLAEWTVRAARACGVRRVALWGGCLDSPILAQGLRSRLDPAGVEMSTASDHASVALARIGLASRAISEAPSA